MAKRNVKRHEVVQPEDQSVKLIPLTHGLNAIVDADDHEWLMAYNWSALYSKNTRSHYAVTNIKMGGKYFVVRMSAVILRAPEGCVVDHIDSGNTLDNRKCNLRIAAESQNCMNRRTRSDNRSGIKGVSWYSRYGMWVARIQVAQKRICLGYFATKEAAAEAYRAAATKHYGEFARATCP